MKKVNLFSLILFKRGLFLLNAICSFYLQCLIDFFEQFPLIYYFEIVFYMCYFFLTSLHFFFFFFHSHLRNVERDEFRLLPIFILFSCAFPNYFARRENVLMHPHSCCITDRETRLNSLNCKHPCHKSRETCRTVLILVQAL